MPRIAPQQPPFPASLQAFLERNSRAGIEPLVMFTTLGRSERAWEKFIAGSLLDSASPLTLRQRELVIDRVTARTGCEYEWGVHVRLLAERAGLSRDDIAATLVYPLAPGHWADAEAALLSAVDALHDRATLTDKEFDNLQLHYSEAQIFEVLQLAGFYHQVAFIANGLALPLETNAARFSDYRA